MFFITQTGEPIVAFSMGSFSPTLFQQPSNNWMLYKPLSWCFQSLRHCGKFKRPRAYRFEQNHRLRIATATFIICASYRYFLQAKFMIR